MKDTFIVLETKIVEGNIQVYGGYIPPNSKETWYVPFKWYKVTEVTNHES